MQFERSKVLNLQGSPTPVSGFFVLSSIHQRPEVAMWLGKHLVKSGGVFPWLLQVLAGLLAVQKDTGDARNGNQHFEGKEKLL